MVTANATSAQKLGYWSAIACTVFSVGYIVLQLLEWFGVLGSAGGPESASTPLGIVLLLTPSLLLGSSFLVLMAPAPAHGYSFMSMATLFAAFALADSGEERVARRFLIANGLVLPFIALQMYWHPLIWIASLWAVTFPGATVSLAVLFARDARTGVVPVAGRPSGPSVTVAAVPGLQG